VTRIFELFLAGHGYYAIAEQLTAQGISSPAGYDRVRTPHRPGRAWGKSAVRAILRNPRYTGYQVWGRQRRDEILLNVDDVAAGHVTRMRWNDAANWVWSSQPTHQPLVDKATFQAAQARIATRSPHSSRTPRTTPRPYLLRGRLHCALCQRRLQGQWIRGEAYYRCRYPAEYAAASDFQHPKSAYLREIDLVGRLDDWLAELFSPANLDHTCHTLATASRSEPPGDQRRAAQQILADCQRRLEGYRAALEAGTDPAVVQQWIAEVTTTRAAAQAKLRDSRHAPAGSRPSRFEASSNRPAGCSTPSTAATQHSMLNSTKSSASTASTTPTATPCASRRNSVGVLVVSEGGLEPPRPIRALGPQPPKRRSLGFLRVYRCCSVRHRRRKWRMWPLEATL
jgi:site-specific DNA recombinase